MSPFPVPFPLSRLNTDQVGFRTVVDRRFEDDDPIAVVDDEGVEVGMALSPTGLASVIVSSLVVLDATVPDAAPVDPDDIPPVAGLCHDVLLPTPLAVRQTGKEGQVLRNVRF